jgi:hypothetical protein
MFAERDGGFLPVVRGADGLPDAPGVLELVVILMRRERRGRSAGSDPAMIPMPSSVRDQKPIFPVP